MADRGKKLHKQPDGSYAPRTHRANGQFETKHKPLPGAGRKKGVPNKITNDVREIILAAAEAVGSDGKGKDGLFGYLRVTAMMHRKAYLAAITKILPHIILSRREVIEDRRYETLEEAEKALLEHGFVIDNVIQFNKR